MTRLAAVRIGGLLKGVGDGWKTVGKEVYVQDLNGLERQRKAENDGSANQDEFTKGICDEIAECFTDIIQNTTTCFDGDNNGAVVIIQNSQVSCGFGDISS